MKYRDLEDSCAVFLRIDFIRPTADFWLRSSVPVAATALSTKGPVRHAAQGD